MTRRYDSVQERIDDLYTWPEAVELPPLLDASPVDHLLPSNRWAPINECAEPLEELHPSLRDLDVFAAFGFPPQRPQVREEVNRRLRTVNDSLPDGLHLVVIEGWRERSRQELLHSLAEEAAGDDAVSYAADPNGTDGVVPPHSTGAAVDLTLGVGTAVLTLGCSIGTYDERAALASFEPDGPEPHRTLRRVLYHAMRAEGFVGIREEWWHYSLFDQEWAVQQDYNGCRYGTVGWS